MWVLDIPKSDYFIKMIQVSEKDIKSLKVTLIEWVTTLHSISIFSTPYNLFKYRVCNATSHTRSKKDLFLVNKTKFTMLVESQNYSPESQATLMKLYDKLDSRKTDSIDCRLILVGMCALSCIPLEERFQCKSFSEEGVFNFFSFQAFHQTQLKSMKLMT